MTTRECLRLAPPLSVPKGDWLHWHRSMGLWDSNCHWRSGDTQSTQTLIGQTMTKKKTPKTRFFKLTPLSHCARQGAARGLWKPVQFHPCSLWKYCNTLFTGGFWRVNVYRSKALMSRWRHEYVVVSWERGQGRFRCYNNLFSSETAVYFV